MSTKSQCNTWTRVTHHIPLDSIFSLGRPDTSSPRDPIGRCQRPSIHRRFPIIRPLPSRFWFLLFISSSIYTGPTPFLSTCARALGRGSASSFFTFRLWGLWRTLSVSIIETILLRNTPFLPSGTREDRIDRVGAAIGLRGRLAKSSSLR
jgi:hypothetical protein